MENFTLYLVSDATGETISNLTRACLVQFEDLEIIERHWSLLHSASQIERLLQTLEIKPGLVLYTMVNPVLRAQLEEGLRRLQIPSVPVLDPIIAALAAYFNRPSRNQPGRQHELDAEYFERIEAVNFALAHDDGHGVDGYREAQAILLGVSRTSKTPTSIYLANRGVRTANFPLVPGHPVPEELLTLPPFHEGGPLIVGLTQEPERLVEIRRQRLQTLGDKSNQYVDLQAVRQEITAAKRLCHQHRWPLIDVTRRSIEETAAAILQMLESPENGKVTTRPKRSSEDG